MSDALTEFDVVTLRPSKRRFLLVIAGLAAPVAAGLYIASEGDWRGAVAAVVFAPGLLVALWCLTPSAAYLQLGPDGFVAKTVTSRSHYSWQQVDNFRKHAIRVTTKDVTQLHHVVAFDLADGVPPGALSRMSTREADQIDARLPDSYGRDPDEIAQLLQRYCDRYS